MNFSLFLSTSRRFSCSLASLLCSSSQSIPRSTSIRYSNSYSSKCTSTSRISISPLIFSTALFRMLSLWLEVPPVLSIWDTSRASLSICALSFALIICHCIYLNSTSFISHSSSTPCIISYSDSSSFNRHWISLVSNLILQSNSSISTTSYFFRVESSLLSPLLNSSSFLIRSLRISVVLSCSYNFFSCRLYTYNPSTLISRICSISTTVSCICIRLRISSISKSASVSWYYVSISLYFVSSSSVLIWPRLCIFLRKDRSSSSFCHISSTLYLNNLLPQVSRSIFSISIRIASCSPIAIKRIISST